MDEYRERQKIGSKLSSLRKEKGISINAITKHYGLKYELVKAIEDGDGYTISSLLRYLDAIKVKVSFSNIVSKVLDFIEMNKDRKDPVGDLCTDLLRDDEFYDCDTDTKRIAYVKGLIGWHVEAVDKAIRQFLEEYAEYKVSENKN